ncbi:N-acetyl-gamma-glutamyl-phosphate reductase [Aquirufa antheringensis]|uniref:N-acetyl-gamma-glutamyl-phosphate reductase n=1 Tax=Aquirufa antheringensis TaxID=2516559 RepID=A0A4Q9BFK2_9BACT|nr:N-acetyl-gamma-glutamyl-phosphate reductase [Aquirufa antheringensis]MCZ2484228.1 N-acetyl-gamma-glutamyl-phosphate reductase [Aquirufa antheringensis]TBH74561.1 N-acetyl-gamma-glutamyl-phosphate reductase [Aquirufa antheringensis]
MAKIGIVGAAGYTGGELLRILVNHPDVHLTCILSNSQAGKLISDVHTDLLGSTHLRFSKDLTPVDVLFLCSGHGESKKFLAANDIPWHTKIIDLSTDFRDESEGFVYGLAEFQKEKIKSATKIANPGCFATSIELALLPLAAAGLITEDVHVSAITGSTGAGQSLSPTSHFSWRNNNVSVYKTFTHQHLAEIKQTLGTKKAIHFIPYRGNFSRGIMANVYTPYSGTQDQAEKLFEDFYANSPFVFLSPEAVDVKQVVNTNKCFLHLQVQEGQILISSVIDNLIKGASGQAVQNMNLMLGWEEDLGLKLKSIGF